MKPLVRIVEDDLRVRQSEAFVLRLDNWDVAEYESAEQFLEFDDPARPGCIVLDIRMPGMSGLELQTVLIQQKRSIPILFLSGHGDIDSAVTALKRGAADFVQKPMDPEKLQQSVRKLVAWHVNLEKAETEQATRQKLFDSLTDREKEICLAVANGSLSKQIAIDLDISEQTVKTHRANISRKLGLHNAVDISQWLKELKTPIDRTYRIAVGDSHEKA